MTEPMMCLAVMGTNRLATSALPNAPRRRPAPSLFRRLRFGRTRERMTAPAASIAARRTDLLPGA